MNSQQDLRRTTFLLLTLGLLVVGGSGSTRSCEPVPEGAVECFSDFECPAGQYCEKPVGACRGAGFCATPPEGCITLWDPVCGCDGNTYGNACEAAAARVNVASEGECDPQAPDRCRTNIDCPRSEYCAKETGDCDGVGRCEPRPEMCIDLWDPVFGCDGVIYSNKCYAARAGQSVDGHIGLLNYKVEIEGVTQGAFRK